MRKGILRDIEVGQTYPTTDGDVMVTEIIDALKVRILFLNPICEKMVQAANIRTGAIRNPMKPNVCGVGFLGVGPYVAKRDYTPNPTHQVWHDMLKRVYTRRTESQSRNYAGTSVHSHWYNFQNFAPWYHDKIDRFGQVDFVGSWKSRVWTRCLLCNS